MCSPSYIAVQRYSSWVTDWIIDVGPKSTLASCGLDGSSTFYGEKFGWYARCVRHSSVREAVQRYSLWVIDWIIDVSPEISVGLLRSGCVSTLRWAKLSWELIGALKARNVRAPVEGSGIARGEMNNVG